MARIYIPKETALVRALRGFGAPGEKPKQSFVASPFAKSFLAHMFAWNTSSFYGVGNELIAGKEFNSTYTEEDNMVVDPVLGHCMQLSTVGDAIIYPYGYFDGSTEATIILQVRIKAIINNNKIINTNGLTLYHDGDSSGVPKIVVQGIGTTLYSDVYAENDVLTYVITMKNGVKKTLAVNGNYLTTGSGSSFSAGGDRVAIAGSADRIGLFAFGNKVISDAEALAISGNPYGLLTEPANQSPIIIGTEAAAATSQYFIPAQSPLTQALRGFGAPGVKPTGPVRVAAKDAKVALLFNNNFQDIQTGKTYPQVGTPTGQFRGYQVGLAYDFNGSSDDAVDISSGIPTSVATGNFLVSVYFRSTKTSGGTDNYFVNHGLTSGSNRFGIYRLAWTNDIRIGLKQNFVDINYTFNNGSDLKWHHIVAGRLNNHLVVFIDGILKYNTQHSEAASSFFSSAQILGDTSFLGQIAGYCFTGNASTFADAYELAQSPFAYLQPANQSPFFIGTAAAGVDYQETISSSVTSSASLVETYQAAGFSEVLASSVTSSASLVETYQAPSYSEVLASSVTSSATFAETYGAPAYSEVLASSVSSSANLVETYGAPNYSEVLASAVTSSASLVEAYEFGQNYQETITASVTSSATLSEAYQAPAYNETITVSVTSSANLVETWEVAYTEVIASAVTSSATLAEIYESGLNFAETISASVTSSANLVETYGAPSYSEVLASAVTSSATFTEAFTTPQALPTIVELSAITLPGYSAKSLRID